MHISEHKEELKTPCPRSNNASGLPASGDLLFISLSGLTYHLINEDYGQDVKKVCLGYYVFILFILYESESAVKILCVVLLICTDQNEEEMCNFLTSYCSTLTEIVMNFRLHNCGNRLSGPFMPSRVSVVNRAGHSERLSCY